MKIETLLISKLIPYEFNNRNHSEEQVDLIANSIKEFGFNQPIVIDESNIILVGHGRLLAAQKLGLKEVPILQLKDLTETQKKAYRILDNKLQNDSTWSFDNLELELGFLEDNGFDLEAWGLDDLRDMFPEEEPEVYEDEAPAVPEETFIKLGDLIELGEHRVLCGDSTSPEEVAELLHEGEPNLLVTDPPYGVKLDMSWRDGVVNKHNSNTNLVENDDRADWTETWQNFKGNIAYIWHASKYSDVVTESLRKADLEPCQQIIWNKDVMTLGRSDYHFKHEPCWYAVRKGCTHDWIGDRSQTTIIEAPSPNAVTTARDKKEDISEHPTQKPIICMSKFIKNHSGDVYDPFLGSGTTLIAADQLGRICYGMEISPKYCEVIIQRYKNHCEKVKKPFICKINGEPYTTFEPIKENGTGKEIRA